MSIFFGGVLLCWQISWSCCFFCKAHKHPKHEVMWQFWRRLFCWWKKVGEFTMAISNPHILGIPQQSAAWPLVNLRTNLPWSMVTWMTRGWSLDPMILKTMEPRSFCDCCCGVLNFWNWNMETFKRKQSVWKFLTWTSPQSSLPGEYERNPNCLGYPIYPIILASFSYLRRLWTLGISTRNESTISLYELSLWCFCFWMLDFMVSPTMKISEACTLYNIYIYVSIIW